MTVEPITPDPENGEGDEEPLQRVSLTVRRELTHRRLDQYVNARLPQLSRSSIQRLIDAGQVTVNGQATKASRRLAPGDVVDVVVPPPQPREIPPEPIPIQVVWEDDCMLAINKQAGIIVHPARGNPHGTLVNGLAYYAGKLSSGGDPFRPGIVHRLDRDTTGIMLVAKTDEAHWRLARQFEARRIHKFYIALVQGGMDLDADRIDAPLARHPRHREKYAVSPENPSAKQAVTVYRVLERFRGFTLLQLEPHTGRTHQLRVHMSHLGHPIVGDRDYGGRLITRADLLASPRAASGSSRMAGSSLDDAPIEGPLIARQALHAWRIQFEHPVTHRPMELEAEPPADMRELLVAVRQLRSLGQAGAVE
ncbi:MAG: Ribosomal large subunit pseudouridine synthase D [Phycisphaerae bacterium]|nr:Ribosomal large subunit pseudouridine synthase D [Phycisphaerae bacterium]